jgi:hypothetical protein
MTEPLRYPPAKLHQPEEANWFLDLEGFPRDQRTHVVHEVDRRLMATYTACNGSGKPVATVSVELPPVHAPRAGQEPLEDLLDVGELVLVADLLAARAGDESLSLRSRRAWLSEAADCLADARTRPEPRFVHERGHAAYRAEPGRFDPQRLAAVEYVWREMIREWGAVDSDREQYPAAGQPIDGPSPTSPPRPGYGTTYPLAASPAVKTSKRPVGLIVSAALLSVVGVAAAVHGMGNRRPDAESANAYLGGVNGVRSSTSSASASTRPGKGAGTVPKGSKASSRKVRKLTDLDEVCVRSYYPKAPKYTTGPAPHPIVVSDSLGEDVESRSSTSLGTFVPYDAPTAVKNAWQPKNLATVQVVACVDLISTGPELRSCKVDDPKISSVPIKEGRYRVTLYEVATRRKLFETKMVGEYNNCPLSVFVVDGKVGIQRSTVDDDQLHEAFDSYVEPGLGSK